MESGWNSYLTFTMPNVSADLLQTISIDDIVSMSGILLSSNPDTGLREYTIEGLVEGDKFSVLELLLDSSFKVKIDETEKIFTESIKTIFQTIDMQKAFANYFQMLWYSTLPCFDIQKLTSMENGTTAMLQQCRWKGRPISCSAIFKTFPTDAGMCCTFNLVKANALFLESEYTKLIMKLQAIDKLNAFTNGTEPEEHLNSLFPEQGVGHGLWVLLDKHSNLLAPRSVFSDLSGFGVHLGSPWSFPYVRKHSIHIQTGHLNSIALSAIAIEADDEIHDVEPKLRGCMFKDETKDLKFHNVYSQTNCFLECSIFMAQKKLQAVSIDNKTCTPWFLPFEGDNHYLCDPWESAKFQEFTHEGRPPGSCNHCLPDCRRTIFQSQVSVLPFGKCDERNLGMTDLCNVGNARSLTQPQIFGQQVLDEFKIGMNKEPEFLKIISSNMRANTKKKIQTFHYINQTYNAFEKDIAELEIFFEVESVLKITTTMKMTWVDFLSNVGGLLGLCLGLSVVTAVELVWLGMRIVMSFLWSVQIKLKTRPINMK